jgi:kynureninase
MVRRQTDLIETPAVTTRAECEALDAADPLASLRQAFQLPRNIIYLDGNSLGACPKASLDRLSRAASNEWADGLIGSWNNAGWFELPRKAGEKIAKLIGAPEGSVIVADTISVNLFKLMAAALELRPNRRVVLTDNGNFPSDIYVLQGLLRHLGRGHELRVVAPEEVNAAIDETVAVVTLTDIDYRTSRRHEMASLTAAAHAAGALTVWDLAHSVGVVELDVEGSGVDFAVGCTYKYLNGGPGSPAFLYVAPDLQERVQSPISGWWGHAEPFAFDLSYQPAKGITRMQCGTQPMLSMAALDAALDIWKDVALTQVREKSLRLTGLLASLVARRCGQLGVELIGPTVQGERGGHVSFRYSSAFAVVQALIARGVVGDFRAPDVMRFGPSPLYIRFVDIWDAATRLEEVLSSREYEHPKFNRRRAVT